MVKLNMNINDGEHNLEMEGKAVVAFVMDPKGHDADCVAMLVGESSPHNIALAMGNGVGSILNQLGKDSFDRVLLAAKVMKQIKKALDGDNIKEKDIFDGTVKEFMARGMEK